MQKGILHTLLRKIAAGDAKSKKAIVPKLADRLVLVPTKSVKSAGSETKVLAITIKEGERSLIPIFTTMAILKLWLEKNEIKGEGLSMNCADVCMALGIGRWIMIDPGTDYWCEIEPEYVEQIGAFLPDEDDFFDDLESTLSPTPPPEPVADRTVEVPIIPQAIAQAAKLNPPSEVKSFPRLRQKDDEDARATMDLTNFRKKFSS